MNIQALLDCGPNVSITVSPLDLKEFATFLIGQAQAMERDKEKPEKYLTPDEVSTLIGVTKNTLWRWEKEHYLTPVKIGRKSRYKQSDVDLLISGKANTNKAVIERITAK